MFNKKIVFVVSLAMCTALGAQSRDASFTRNWGNSEVGSSIDLSASVNHGTYSVGNYSHARLNNDAEFSIAGVNSQGIEVQALAYGIRYSNGSFYATNWNGVYRGGNSIHSHWFTNRAYNRSFGAGTVVDRARTYRVGPYTVSAQIRVSAGAQINLTQQSFANSFGRSAFLDGSTRTYQDGAVWNVFGFGGATASISSTLEMGDTTMNVNLDATPGSQSGNFTFSLGFVKLFMQAKARRYWWQRYSFNTIVNTSSSATSGTRILL